MLLSKGDKLPQWNRPAMDHCDSIHCLSRQHLPVVPPKVWHFDHLSDGRLFDDRNQQQPGGWPAAQTVVRPE
jgi:hypothetical protein